MPEEKTIYLQTVESPAGPLHFAVDSSGALVRTRFAAGEYGPARGASLAEELEFEGYAPREDARRTARAAEELLQYAAGERRSFGLPLAPVGSEWQRAVWAALGRIPYAGTRTYAEVAAMAGRPRAARAVGRANATNPLPLVVPCHRVVGSGGALTGFAGGLHLKTDLLEHERRIAVG